MCWSPCLVNQKCCNFRKLFWHNRWQWQSQWLPFTMKTTNHLFVKDVNFYIYCHIPRGINIRGRFFFHTIFAGKEFLRHSLAFLQTESHSKKVYSERTVFAYQEQRYNFKSKPPFTAKANTFIDKAACLASVYSPHNEKDKDCMPLYKQQGKLVSMRLTSFKKILLVQ